MLAKHVTPSARVLLSCLLLAAACLQPLKAADPESAITRLHQSLCKNMDQSVTPGQLSNDLYVLQDSISFMLDTCKYYDHLQKEFISFLSTVINAEHSAPTQKDAKDYCETALSRFVLQMARTLPNSRYNKSIRHHLSIIYGYYTRIPLAQRVHLLPQLKKPDSVVKWLGVGVIASVGALLVASSLYLVFSKGKQATNDNVALPTGPVDKNGWSTQVPVIQSSGEPRTKPTQSHEETDGAAKEDSLFSPPTIVRKASDLSRLTGSPDNTLAPTLLSK